MLNSYTTTNQRVYWWMFNGQLQSACHPDTHLSAHVSFVCVSLFGYVRVWVCFRIGINRFLLRLNRIVFCALYSGYTGVYNVWYKLIYGIQCGVEGTGNIQLMSWGTDKNSTARDIFSYFWANTERQYTIFFCSRTLTAVCFRYILLATSNYTKKNTANRTRDICFLF